MPPILESAAKGVAGIIGCVGSVVFVGFIFVLMAEDGSRGRNRARLYAKKQKLERDSERSVFYERTWTKREAHLKLKEYHREIEQRGLLFANHHFPNLTREEIHQRIDFLESAHFDDEKKEPELPKQPEPIKEPELPDAELRNAFDDWCDTQKNERTLAFKKKHHLTDVPESQYTNLHRQEFKRNLAYWDDRKHKGPPKGWSEHKKG